LEEGKGGKKEDEGDSGSEEGGGKPFFARKGLRQQQRWGGKRGGKGFCRKGQSSWQAREELLGSLRKGGKVSDLREGEGGVLLEPGSKLLEREKEKVSRGKKKWSSSLFHWRVLLVPRGGEGKRGTLGRREFVLVTNGGEGEPLAYNFAGGKGKKRGSFWGKGGKGRLT